MAAMSIKKLGGICLVVGAIAGAVPVILSVFLGATPTEGVNIFKFFADEAVKNGIVTNAYALISIIGVALVTFGIFTLRDILQNDETDNALMRFGTYLFFLGSVGAIIGWSLDNAIVWGEADFAKHFMTIEMAFYLPSGILYWAGAGLVALTLAGNSYVNSLFARFVCLFALIACALHIYTILSIDPNSVTTIMPLFVLLGISNLIGPAFFISIGIKMIK